MSDFVGSRDIDRRLAEILADLYPDVSTAQAVARYVGLDTQQIAMQGSAFEVWARIVQWARSHRKTAQLIAYARADVPEREDLRELAVAEVGKGDREWAMEDLGNLLSGQLEGLREEMRAMEQRLGRRIDGVDAKMDTLRAASMQYTDKKRNAWLIGFLLFSLPSMLFMPDIRLALGLTMGPALLVISLCWGAACVLLMYGMGMIRNL